MQQKIETLQSLQTLLGEEFWQCARLLSDCQGVVWVTAVGTSAAVGIRFAHILTCSGARSMFLSTQWMDPILVSDPGVDSRDPVVTVLPVGRIQIEFSTPDGRVLRIIVINRSQTITDDIDPFSTLTLEPLRPAPGPTGMGF